MRPSGAMSDYFRLWNACEQGDMNQVKVLVDQIEDINKPNDRGWNAIILASFNHHRDVVEYLLKAGADINSVNANGTSVFMYAKTKVLENNNYAFLDFLIQSGANLNLRDRKNNWTVLQYAKELKNPTLVKYLISKGAK